MFWHVYLLQVVEQIRSGTGPKKILVIDMDTEREMVAKVSQLIQDVSLQVLSVL